MNGTNKLTDNSWELRQNCPRPKVFTYDAIGANMFFPFSFNINEISRFLDQTKAIRSKDRN